MILDPVEGWGDTSPPMQALLCFGLCKSGAIFGVEYKYYNIDMLSAELRDFFFVMRFVLNNKKTTPARLAGQPQVRSGSRNEQSCPAIQGIDSERSGDLHPGRWSARRLAKMYALAPATTSEPSPAATRTIFFRILKKINPLPALSTISAMGALHPSGQGESGPCACVQRNGRVSGR